MNTKIWSLICAAHFGIATWATEATLVGEWPEVRRGGAGKVQVANGKAYIASTEFLVVDVSAPAAPALMGHVALGNLYPNDVALRDQHAFVTTTNGLHVIDVSAPRAPGVVARHEATGAGLRITISGEFAYVADGESGLRIYNIATPQAPTLVSTTRPTGTYATDVVIHQNIAYVSYYYNGSGLFMFDVSNPDAPAPRGNVQSAYIDGLAVSGNLLFAAARFGGLLIFDLTDPLNPVQIASLDTDQHANQVKVNGNIAAVADRGGGLVLIDVSNPAAPVRLSVFEPTAQLSSYTDGVEIAGNFVFAADRQAGLQILDISNPAAPIGGKL